MEIPKKHKHNHLKASAGIPGAQPLAPLAADPALSLAAVAEALRSFFVAVSSPDALPEFAAIQSPRLRSDAVSRWGGCRVVGLGPLQEVTLCVHGGCCVQHTVCARVSVPVRWCACVTARVRSMPESLSVCLKPVSNSSRVLVEAGTGLRA